MQLMLRSLMLTGEQEGGTAVPAKQVNVDLSRIPSRRHPVESPSAAGTPQKRLLRKTASAVSPRKNQGKSAVASALPLLVLLCKQYLHEDHISK